MENHGGAAAVAQTDDPTLPAHLPEVGTVASLLIAGFNVQPLEPESLPGPACHSTNQLKNRASRLRFCACPSTSPHRIFSSS